MCLTLDRALMSGSLSCILPAVSTNTTSIPCMRAAEIVEPQSFGGHMIITCMSCDTHTIIYGSHCNFCRILPVTLLIKDHILRVTLPLRRMEGVEVTVVRLQLLHCSGSECVTGSYHHSEVILHQPETHLSIAPESIKYPNHTYSIVYP